MNPSTRPHPRLPRAVVALGFVSLCMDASSELVHSLLPVFLVGALGVSAESVGLIEGIAEATAAIGKVFSGTLSDRIGRRKPLVLLGYGLSALTKPLFPLAQGIALVLAARFVDRIGKGIRDAPRDALVADITPVASRGAAYGLRQALDTAGAVGGPGLALALMCATHDDFRLVFWVAVVPAVIAVLLIVFDVQEPQTRANAPPRGRTLVDPDELRRLPAAYWLVVAFATALTLARFSEAFLLLRVRSVGLPVTYVPVVLIVMNVVYAATAWPLGQWSDRVDRRRLLALGIAFLLVADVQLAVAPSAAWVLVGAMFWGLHMGATQGLLTTLVADVAPTDLRGAAFGLFNLLTGLALLAASVLAGMLWTAVGPAMTFTAGAGFSLLALVGLLVASRRRGSPPPRSA